MQYRARSCQERVVAQTLVSAAPRLISALGACTPHATRVETSLDPAGTSARATRAGTMNDTVGLQSRRAYYRWPYLLLPSPLELVHLLIGFVEGFPQRAALRL